MIGRVDFDDWSSWLVYSPAVRKLYSDVFEGVAVIDPRTDQEIARMDLGGSLDNVILNSSGTRLYGTTFWHDAVYVIDCVRDISAGAIPVPAGNPQALCYNSIDDKLYVNNEHWSDSGGVTVIDCAREAVDTVLPIAGQCFYFDRQTDAVFCIGERTIYVVDGRTNRVIIRLPSDSYLTGLASAPGWPRVYAAWNNYPVSSGISVIHKNWQPAELQVRAAPDAQATVVRKRFDWIGTLAVMYDRSGRRVADVHRGGNDVSRMEPGVYFVRQNGIPRGTYARKVVIAE